jgi:hypothetical protein
MGHLTKLPDLAKSFQKLKIMVDLDIKATGDSLLAFSIRLALYKKESPDEIITWIKSQATDNPKIIAEVIGDELTQTILNY